MMPLQTQTAQQFLDSLERWCNLQLTFRNGKCEFITKCYSLVLDEEIWSLFIKQFNLKDWHSVGAKRYWEVFECCTGEKLNVIYIHTSLMAICAITKEKIPVGAQLINVEQT